MNVFVESEAILLITTVATTTERRENQVVRVSLWSDDRSCLFFFDFSFISNTLYFVLIRCCIEYKMMNRTTNTVKGKLSYFYKSLKCTRDGFNANYETIDTSIKGNKKKIADF